MHCSSWLTFATVLSVPVSAFYPYHRGGTSLKGVNEVTTSDRAVRSRGAQPLTLDIKRRRIRWNKRENTHHVSEAAEPTTPNSMGISQDGEDHSYFSSVQIGSGGKKMWMLIDSGSANTWVFGSDCTSKACSEHDTFGAGDSDTLETTSSTWEVKYGSGNITGVVVNDKFSFAGYDVQLGFGLATEASDDFTTFPMDGIIGLGRDTSNQLKSPTLMEAMVQEKLLDANIYCIELSRSADGEKDGQITFGAPDKSRFVGDISYTDSVADDGLWKIPADGCAVDGQSLGLKGKNAIIDTGTSFILMPLDDALALHDKIPGSANRGRDFTIPCDTQQTISFTFSGVTYDVPAKDYVGKQEESGGKCSSNIIGKQAFGRDDWLLGDAFLKNVYTIFDFDEHRIGFGIKSDAKDGATPTSSDSAPTSSTTGKSASGDSTSPETAPSSGKPADEKKPQSATSQASELSPADNESNRPEDVNGATSSASSLPAIYSLCLATLYIILCI